MDSKETVGDLKERIYADQGINIKQQMIVFCGKELSNNEIALKEFGIQEHSTMQLVVQMNGGKIF
jgi:3-mercaptopyruvate sulfurtransferase SseA